MGQPSFCILCKRNNEDGKRHPYTKAHQERVKSVLEKQAEQFKKYKPFLLEVAILSSVAAQPVFWCTFCRIEVRPTAADVMAHTRVFACLHIFEHMATAAHHAKVDVWFETYRGDFKAKKAHVMSDKTLKKFHERVTKKEEELDRAEQMERSKKRKEATEVSTQEGWVGWQAMPTLDPTGWHDTGGVWDGGIAQAAADVSSLAAVAFGPAPSSRTSEESGLMYGGDMEKALEMGSGEGPKSEQTQGAAAPEVGPSIQDFLRAKEAGKKRKRNPGGINPSASKRNRKWGPGS